MEKIQDKAKLGKAKPNSKKFAKEKGRRAKYIEDRIAGKQPKAPYIGPNNIEWRTGDKVMTKLTANLPFGFPAGLPVSVETEIASGSTPAVSANYTQPGVLSIAVKVTMGTANNFNSAVNLAARKIYSFTRHANSGSKNYEAADMGIYFGCLGQALAYLGWLQRLLRLCNEYSTTNRYTPTYLFSAMGVNHSMIIAEQAKLKYLIAWFGRAIGSLAFPDIPYFHACYEAFKYIYRDNDSPKEQYYLTTWNEFGVFDPTTYGTGGSMTYDTAISGIPTVIMGVASLSYSNLESIAHSIMDVLLSDEDCGIISGDILKAFKDGGLFKPQAFGDDYEIFQHSPEFLQQVHNLHIVRKNDFDIKDYKQNVGAINTAPYIDLTLRGSAITGSLTCMTQHTLIDAFSKEPEPEEVVNCLTYNPQFYPVPSGTGFSFTGSGARYSFDLFLPQGITMIWGLGAGDYTVMDQALGRYGSTAKVASGLSLLSLKLTNFDWHPLNVKEDNNTSEPRITGDIQNLRWFDFSVGERIHENSMLSLLAFQEHNFY